SCKKSSCKKSSINNTSWNLKGYIFYTVFMRAKVGGRRVIELDDRDVVYEDNHLIGINKEAGDLVQGDETGDMPLVEALEYYLKEKYNKPFKAFVGMIHRLDRPVSGLVLFGKTSKAQVRVQKLFKDRKIIKTYI